MLIPALYKPHPTATATVTATTATSDGFSSPLLPLKNQASSFPSPWLHPFSSSNKAGKPSQALHAASSSASSNGASPGCCFTKEERGRERRIAAGHGGDEADGYVIKSDDSLRENHHSSASSLRLCVLDSVNHSYRERFAIRCYEVGMNGSASIETIANLLQEAACNHVKSVGFSTDGFATTPSMRKRRLIWVTTRMHIEVNHYPTWGDVVQVETWCQSEGKVGIRRDWLLTDVTTNKLIGRATSTWVMMNKDSRRLSRITDDIRQEYEQYCPIVPRYAFPEDNSNCLKKIPMIPDQQHITPGLRPRRGDLDMNQHVNNVTYIGWVLESVPLDLLDSHQLHTITLDYRRECNSEDVVDSLACLEVSDNDENKNQNFGKIHGYEKMHTVDGTSSNDTVINGSSIIINGNTSNGAVINGSLSTLGSIFPASLEFLHLLRFATNEMEINRGRTVWKPKYDKSWQ